jgi:hypothetical protein
MVAQRMANFANRMAQCFLAGAVGTPHVFNKRVASNDVTRAGGEA